VYVICGALILGFGFLHSPGPSTVALLTVAAAVPGFFLFRRNDRNRPAP